jgi:hypothetical protein
MAAADPGIGPLIATAIVAAVGKGAAFRKAVSSRLGSDVGPTGSTQPVPRPTARHRQAQQPLRAKDSFDMNTTCAEAD